MSLSGSVLRQMAPEILIDIRSRFNGREYILYGQTHLVPMAAPTLLPAWNRLVATATSCCDTAACTETCAAVWKRALPMPEMTLDATNAASVLVIASSPGLTR